MSLLHLSWHRCWHNLGASGDDVLLMQKLVNAYQESHRHYHTLQHLEECLRWFEGHRDLAEEPAEVEMALWFHDAIYNVRANDNETKSADWAHQALLDAEVDSGRVARIRQLILATRHTAAPEGNDQALLVDIDLAILGAPSQRFDEYELQIRKEYAWVPGIVFRQKRRNLLRQFLSRPAIYHTAKFNTLLEKQARANLIRSLKNCL